jgi:serine/threonine-protein kinase
MYASWGRRVGARLLDALWLIALSAATLGASYGVGYAVKKDDGAAVGLVVAVVADGLICGLYYLVGAASGQTVGKKALAIRTARADGSPLRFWRALGRDLLSIVNSIPLFLGWFAPLWTVRRQTFADALIGSVTLRGDTPSGARAAVRSALVLALLTVGGAAAGAQAWGDRVGGYDGSYTPYDSSLYDPPTEDPASTDPGTDFDVPVCDRPLHGSLSSNELGSYPPIASITFTNECSTGIVINQSDFRLDYTSACSGTSYYDFSGEPMELPPYASHTVEFELDSSSVCGSSASFSWTYRYGRNSSLTETSGPSYMSP